MTQLEMDPVVVGVPGKKFDQGKVQWDLIPWQALEEVTKAFQFGLAKYDVDDWRHVKGYRRKYLSSTWRHVRDWMKGETRDPESGLHPLAHAGAGLLILLARELPQELSVLEVPETVPHKVMEAKVDITPERPAYAYVGSAG